MQRSADAKGSDEGNAGGRTVEKRKRRREHAMPETDKILGIDVSHHQGYIDWEGLSAQADVRFVYLKATEGQDYVDPRFGEYAEQCYENNIPFGCYHFGRPFRGR